MPATDITAMQQNAGATWTAFQAALFIGGGSIVLWTLVFTVLRWLI